MKTRLLTSLSKAVFLSLAVAITSIPSSASAKSKDKQEGDTVKQPAAKAIPKAAQKAAPKGTRKTAAVAGVAGVTPIPEPKGALAGALLLALCIGSIALHRRRTFPA